VIFNSYRFYLTFKIVYIITYTFPNKSIINNTNYFFDKNYSDLIIIGTFDKTKPTLSTEIAFKLLYNLLSLGKIKISLLQIK